MDRDAIHIDDLDDPRLAPYRGLKERELARAGGRFIAEGEYVVRRLLESDFPAESVLVARRRLAELAAVVPPAVPLYVVPDALVPAVVGYKFHAGVLAVGRRKPPTPLEAVAGKAGRLTLVVCPEVAGTDNMGALVRISAGFGADAIVLGERCCDPFFRQSVRVSMGAVFRLPIVRSQNLLGDLGRLRPEWGVELAAAVLDEGAEPLCRALRPERFGVLFGNEAHGLSPEHAAACDRRVTIPMKLGTDSLNVAVAAGVFLYHFTREEAFGAR